MEKKISVVMCTYNGAEYLKEQIESIINQTYPVYELIIQDDCSTDHTMDILLEYENKYSYIHVFRNEKQKGINENFFSAIDRATGDYIALSDQDDVWLLDKIEKQIIHADDYLLVTGISESFACGDGVKIHNDERLEINTNLERQIYVNSLAGHTMLFRKTFIEKIPDPIYWYNYFMYDYVIAIVAAANNSIFHVPQQLVNHRRLTYSASYGEPFSYKKTLPSIVRFFGRTFVQYCQLRPQMRIFFIRLYYFLDAIDISSDAKKNAMTLVNLQSKRSLISYIDLTILCVRLRNKLFHTKEKNVMLSILRAIYFPISCSDYFSYLLKKPLSK
jgi:glycosyltransferase involved in cell wall biosynthesis